MALSNNLIGVALIACAALGALPAQAQSPRMPDYALDAWFGENRHAIQPAFEWAKKQRMICEKPGPRGGRERCTIASRTEHVSVLAPAPELAIVQICFNPSTGNRCHTIHLLLGRKKSGEFRIMREMRNIPSSMTKATYEGGRLIIEVLVRKPDDLGCCPSGVGRYAYDLRSEKVDYLWGDRPEH